MLWPIRPLTLPAGLLLALAACDLVFPDEAVTVLKDIVAGGGPSALKEETPAPARVTVTYRSADGQARSADLYDPRQPVGAPLVLVPGAAQAGKDDPRLVALADSLARARFLVLVPDLDGPRQLKISAADADGIADAVLYLAERSGPAAGRGVGVAAISYAVGPAVLAAVRDDVTPNVRFVLGLGGYYDTRAMITFITTGAYRDPEGAVRRAAPLDYAKWVFVLSNLDRIESRSDRDALSAMARRRLRDPGAPIHDLIPGLGPEGRALLTLLLNDDPALVGRLIRDLPAPVRAEIDALSLARRDLSPLAGKLILIHGEADRMIPYTESIALAAAAPRTELFIIDGFSHVDPDGIPLSGQRQLVEAMRAVLARRAPMPGPT